MPFADYLDFGLNESAIDSLEDPQFKAFTHSSSFVGNVRYDQINQQMRIKLNNKNYDFCNVPERIYSAFQGSSSKGEYFNRNIKKQFQCTVSEATNNASTMDWPPEKLDYPDTVDVLMPNYMPEGDRPDGITPDEQSLQTEPQPTGEPYMYPEVEELSYRCGNCKFYVDGGACALVKGAIDPQNGICKFHELGRPLPYNTQIFPVYEQTEAEYKIIPTEPYLSETNEDPYTATGAKKDSHPSMHNEHGHQVKEPRVMGLQNQNPDPDALIFDIPPLYDKPGQKSRTKETKLIRETVGELQQQFNWMTPDYLKRVSELSGKVGGRFVLVRASAEVITDHRSEGEPYRRMLHGDELAQLTRTGINKTTDINHYAYPPHPDNPDGVDYRVDSEVLDAEYDPIRKESQMLVHLRDPEIIRYIESGDISAVSINAGPPRHMHTECDTGECFLVPRGLLLGENDGIAFTWVVTNPRGLTWKGVHIPKATPGVSTTKLQLL